MAQFDVFNGDADGICALLQLRLAEPLESQLVTGVKRDINLLAQVSASAGDCVNVLDVSLDKNRLGLETALSNGAEVFYVDHHFSGDIPDVPNLNAIINTTADVCTSILVNSHLDGQFIEWAIVGAFGDNLKKSALMLCEKLDLSESQISDLENLGIYINYNGYGASLDDLHFTPTDLYRRLSQFESPLLFIENAKDDFDKLADGYHADMASAEALLPEFANESTAVFLLPNENWARRVGGVYSNSLANQFPSRAHAVLTLKENSSYLVSIRAPLNNKTGADEFCRQFETGGGRAAAAGINDLPKDKLSSFIERFKQFY
ncbi:MAG: DHH family phosphoesterase [Gammaproteobacteria bacterium]|nr:DHH family phosphoesterase [Gammaproteobacteria bacterium]